MGSCRFDREHHAIGGRAVSRLGRGARILFAALAMCAGIASPAHAEEQPPPKLKPSVQLVSLAGADCSFCWLSGAFAPSVLRENAAVLTLANEGQQPVKVAPRFRPTNGPALDLKSAAALGLPAEVEIPPGQSVTLPLRLANGTLNAGLYTGELDFAAAGRTVLSVPVETRIRASVMWALLVAICGIVLGRLAQLVYDQKMVARLQLLDRLNDIGASLEGVADEATRQPLRARLDSLRRRLAGRAGDAPGLTPEVEALEKEVEAALSAGAPGAAANKGMGPQMETPAPPVGGAMRWPLMALRWLAGVTPVPLQAVYDWLLPSFVLLTLVVFTVIFVLQQYGGSGTATTFGAGGLSDYAGLFLAGVASEAIAGGLRALKMK